MPLPPNPGPRDVAPGTQFGDGQLTVVGWERRQETWGAWGHVHRQTRLYCVVQCRCGVVFATRPDNLRKKRTSSCGCVNAAKSRIRMRQTMRTYWAQKKGRA